jgi:hypothetical protein
MGVSIGHRRGRANRSAGRLWRRPRPRLFPVGTRAVIVVYLLSPAAIAPVRRLGSWMVANVAVAQGPAGNLKPAKDKSTERIDGIVALIMAIGRAIVAQEEPQPEYQMLILR